MIIGISGRMRSGKDTAGNILLAAAQKDGLEFTIKKFADPVKRIASLLTGIPVAELEKSQVKNSYLSQEWNDPNLVRLVGNVDDARITVREMLQKIGTDCIRDHLHPNAWVNALMKDYHPFMINAHKIFPNWIITDVRFPNEFKAIKDRGGILIRMIRDDLPDNFHISEIALDREKDWTYIVDNNGSVEDLIIKMKTIWKEIYSSLIVYKNT